MKTKCIIVEDEPIAVEILETYINNLPELELTAKCQNAVEAFRVLQNSSFDLMFLDIHMPQISGLEFMKTLSNPPKIIITTAHRKYAVEGFELDVVDYLLKPVSFERFMKAVDKYYQRSKSALAANYEFSSPPNEEPFVYVKADRKVVKVFLKDILYLESMKDYVVIFQKDKKIVTKDNISFFEHRLPQNMFLRIHRSYIVSISKIHSVTKTSVEICNKELPISRNYKNSVLKTLKIDEI